VRIELAQSNLAVFAWQVVTLTFTVPRRDQVPQQGHANK